MPVSVVEDFASEGLGATQILLDCEKSHSPDAPHGVTHRSGERQLPALNVHVHVKARS